MKNKYIILLLDLMLVLIVGFVFGFSFGDHIFAESVRIVAFVSLLGTLILPSVLYVISKKALLGTKIILSLFIVIEVILNIIFITVSQLDGKALAITQGIVISLVLISLIIIVSLFRDEPANDKVNA